MPYTKIADIAIDKLEEYKSQQEIQRVNIGDQWINSNKVFTQVNGSPIHPDTVSGWFRDFIKK